MFVCVCAHIHMCAGECQGEGVGADREGEREEVGVHGSQLFMIRRVRR